MITTTCLGCIRLVISVIIVVILVAIIAVIVVVIIVTKVMFGGIRLCHLWYREQGVSDIRHTWWNPPGGIRLFPAWLQSLQRYHEQGKSNTPVAIVAIVVIVAVVAAVIVVILAVVIT